MPWVRHCLLALWQTGFTRVPSDVAADLVAWSESVSTTKTVEDAFNICRDVGRASKSGCLGPKAAWHRVCASNVGPDADRPVPPTTASGVKLAGDIGGQKPLPASCFTGHAGEFSLGDQVLRTLTSPGIGTVALMQSEGDPEVLAELWKSLLFIPNSIARYKGER